MITKVCGINSARYFDHLAELPIDWLGFIFYPGSKRYAGENRRLISALEHVQPQQKRTGVFVDASYEEILEHIESYNLTQLQFHGYESPEFIERFTGKYITIKVFHIDTNFDFSQCDKYPADYFLFDTSSPEYGGSGLQFDWRQLEKYHGTTPFILSGGIGDADVEKIKTIQHSQFTGIDLNSKFEDHPGMKNPQRIHKFLKQLK